MELFKAYYKSPLGLLQLTGNQYSLTGIHFVEDVSQYPVDPLPPPLEAAVRWLDAYFANNKPLPDLLPLQPSGTPFQQDVWEQIQQIPYGQTITYGQIAVNVAKKRGVPHMSAQAVGQAAGANPIPIIIPCHRVIGTNGKITGYVGGILRKMQLLEHEQATKQK